jgi:hypothetical protein
MRFLTCAALALTALAGCAKISPHSDALRLARVAAVDEPGFSRPCVDPQREDVDGDGLADECEDTVADRFAPIVIHSSDESNLPTDVDDFLASTALEVRDETCAAADRPVVVTRAPTQADLLHHAFPTPCGGVPIASDGSRSAGKHRTFFLSDVDNDLRAGSGDARRWTTYVHSYPNSIGGITVQYWRFYAYNDALNNHGGDWEGIHVVLDRHLVPASVGLLGHTSITQVAPKDFAWEGEHVRVYSEGGGHATHASGDTIGARNCEAIDPCVVSLEDKASYIRQETWHGGHVSWPDGRVVPNGALKNVGEKSAPRNGQIFVRYSGLWGSPGTFFGTSGYWGPAFNETGMHDDGYTTAWCDGMAGALDRGRECWADDREP